MVKSKSLRFSAEDKTTGMWTNPKLIAPFHNGRDMIRPACCARQDHGSRFMPISKILKYRDGEKERSLSRIHHFLSAHFISERQQEYTVYLLCLGFHLFRGSFDPLCRYL
jgi:hypothetical protein